MIQFLILADDCTGALDCGAQLKKGGANVRVMIRGSISFDKVDPDTEVVVINTETRHLKPPEAKEIVRKLSEQGSLYGIPYIYKKTDSALRGNIGAELEGAAEGAGSDHVYFVPAFPALNRITKKGIHYIDGLPLNESSFGCDPFEPATDSDISSLLRRQTNYDVRLVQTGETPKQENGKAIYLFDAETNDDLDRITEILRDENGLKVMAGCSGFAAYLPKFLHLKGSSSVPRMKVPGLLAVSGTTNEAGIDQIEHAKKTGFDVIELDRHQMLNAFTCRGDGEKLISEILQRFDSSRRMILTVCTSYVPKDAAARLVNSRRIVRNLGRIVKVLYDKGFQGLLMATGGDILQGILNAIGCAEVIPIHEIETGVELCKATVTGGSVWIVSKAGSMGTPEVYKKVADFSEKLSEKPAAAQEF